MAGQISVGQKSGGQGARGSRRLRTALAIGVLAFLAGLALMAWALTRWEPARRLIQPPPVVLPQAAVPTTQPALPQPSPPAAIAATDLRVAELENRIVRIDTRAAAAAGNADRAEGLLLAFAARRAIDRGASLGYLEGALRERFAGTQPRAVAAIIAAAQAPVTLAMLRQELDSVAPQLLGVPADDDWLTATKRTLGSLVVVRRADQPSTAPDERIARARLQVDGGQVDAALAEVARLPGRAKADAWMTAARRHVEAHRALDIIEATAITAPRPELTPQTAMPEPMQ